MREKGESGGRQGERARAALDEVRADARFELLQVRADRRLRAVHLLRGAGDGARAGDGDEAAQPGGVEVIHLKL